MNADFVFLYLRGKASLSYMCCDGNKINSLR